MPISAEAPSHRTDTAHPQADQGEGRRFWNSGKRQIVDPLGVIRAVVVRIAPTEPEILPGSPSNPGDDYYSQNTVGITVQNVAK